MLPVADTIPGVRMDVVATTLPLTTLPLATTLPVLDTVAPTTLAVVVRLALEVSNPLRLNPDSVPTLVILGCDAVDTAP